MKRNAVILLILALAVFLMILGVRGCGEVPEKGEPTVAPAVGETTGAPVEEETAEELPDSGGVSLR